MATSVNLNAAIAFYPNPATNEVRISWPNAARGSAGTVSVTSIDGRLLISEGVVWQGDVQRVPLSSLSNGVYMVAVQDKNGNRVAETKIVVAR